jgi:hypothetical protein
MYKNCSTRAVRLASMFDLSHLDLIHYEAKFFTQTGNDYSHNIPLNLPSVIVETCFTYQLFFRPVAAAAPLPIRSRIYLGPPQFAAFARTSLVRSTEREATLTSTLHNTRRQLRGELSVAYRWQVATNWHLRTVNHRPADYFRFQQRAGELQ